MSLPEILVSVSVVAILTMLAIPNYMSYFGSSKATLASSLLETLNTAVHRFNEGNYELSVTAGTDSTASVELSVVRTLQYRNPLNPKVGSPYMHARWNPVASSSTHRLPPPVEGHALHPARPRHLRHRPEGRFQGGRHGHALHLPVQLHDGGQLTAALPTTTAMTATTTAETEELREKQITRRPPKPSRRPATKPCSPSRASPSRRA